MTRFAVAVDFGGTNIRAAAIGADATIWRKHKEPTEARQGKDAVLNRLVSAIERVIAYGRAEGGEPVGLGIGAAGVIRAATGVVTESPNFPDWRNVPLRQELARRVSLLLWVENDANAAALGEHWAGIGRGIDNLICITLGTGVGGGIILDGRLWRGVDGAAGEVGHMSLDPAGPRCSCGRAGCLEAYASATAIVRMARDAMARHEPTHLGPLADAHAEGLTAALVYQAAIAGDDVARHILHEMGRYLGIALANLVNLLNVELCVLSGGVTGAWELFSGIAEAEMRRRAFDIPARRVRIARGMWADEAGLLGAASLVWQRQP